MVNEDWVKRVLRDLYNEAAARPDSAEALMFRQAASLIEQFHSPNKKNPDPQTVGKPFPGRKQKRSEYAGVISRESRRQCQGTNAVGNGSRHGLKGPRSLA
jgi:hypothetical protein